jgi:hypothetical protein
MASSPGMLADFRESLYRMILALIRIGVTIIRTVEIDDSVMGIMGISVQHPLHPCNCR